MAAEREDADERPALPGPSIASAVNAKLTNRAQARRMGKVIIVALAILLALWWTGADVTSIKDSLNGTASEGSRSLTGKSDDWG